MKQKILKVVAVFFFITVAFSLTGQNLLSNGGFETYHQCPYTENAGTSFVDGYLMDWHQSLGGRMHHTDCFNGDNDFWYFISTDSLDAFSGEGFTSDLRFRSSASAFKNKRDYLMAPLNEVMIADSTYHVSYYIHCNRNYAMIDHFGATFVQDTSELFIIQDTNGMCLLTNHYVGYENKYLGPDDKWHHIQGCYTAKGGERWIALGQFLPLEEVNWHPTHEGFLANSTAIFILDDVSVKPVSKQKESDHDLVACDGDFITLPQSENSNVRILDKEGKEVESITVDWPETYMFYYQDPCFGELGQITVDTETCFDEVIIEDELCENENVSFSDYFSDGSLFVTDDDGQTLTSFGDENRGTNYFTLHHQKYGDVGEITLEVLECNDCKMNIPNVISLRNQHNNKFGIATKCEFDSYEITIFDRWGNQHFKTDDPSKPWIPKLNIQSDVYMYLIKYKFRNPLNTYKEKIVSGSLTVLK